MHCIRGTVVDIPSNVLAFVDAESDIVNGAVVLLRSSFRGSCERIQEVVNLGDKLCLKVRLGRILSSREQWYAVEAWKEETGSHKKLQTKDVVSSEESSQARKAISQAKLAPQKKHVRPKAKMAATANKKVLQNADVGNNTNPLGPISSQVSSAVRVMYGVSPLKSFYVALKFYFNDAVAFLLLDGQIFEVAYGDLFIGGSVSSFKHFSKYVKSKCCDVHYEGVIQASGHCKITCLWIGPKPSMYKRLAAYVSDECVPVVLDKVGRTFVGVVSNYFLPDTAVISVADFNYRVFCHISAFDSVESSETKLITDYVTLNQSVEFILTPGPLLIASTARVLKKEEVQAKEQINCRAKEDSLHAKETIEESNRETKTKEEMLDIMTTYSKTQPLERKRTSGFEVIVNGNGIFKLVQNVPVVVTDFVPITVLINGLHMYTNGKAVEQETFISKNLNQQVNFEAKKTKKIHTTGATYASTICWVGEKPHPEQYLKDKLHIPRCPANLDPNGLYRGEVTHAVFNDCCVVQVGNVPVLVPISCLVVDPRTKDKSAIVIGEYLSCGDTVVVKCSRIGEYFVAKSCSALINTENTSNSVTETHSYAHDSAAIKDETEEELIERLHCPTHYLKEDTSYDGIVTELLSFKNAAIVMIGVLPVLVPLISIIRKTEDDFSDNIEDYLNPGCPVSLCIVRQYFMTFPYFLACEVLPKPDVHGMILKNNVGRVVSVVSDTQWKIKVRIGLTDYRLDADFDQFRLCVKSPARSETAIFPFNTISQKLKIDAEVRVVMIVTSDSLLLDEAWLL